MIKRCDTGELLDLMSKRRIPFAVSFELTNKCNLNCVHCYRIQSEQNILDTQEVKNVLDQLADLGGMEITFTGGEPFLRNDFFPLLHYAVEEKGFSVKIFTNGTLLSREYAREIAGLPVLSVEITVLGVDSDVHDALTRVSGSYNHTLNGIEYLIEAGVYVTARTILMKENVHQIQAMEEWAEKLTIPFSYDFVIFPTLDGNDFPLEHQLELENVSQIPEVRENMQALQEYKEFGTCTSGRSVLAIMANGDVMPCSPLYIPAGNVREKSLRKIWESSVVLDCIRKLCAEDYNVCRNCDFCLMCQGCYAMGWSMHKIGLVQCSLLEGSLSSLLD